MKRANSPWRAASRARVDWRGGSPRSLEFDDIYYSPDDGLAESRHVFLHGNGLPARWHEPARPLFVIGETGFGSGLNFLATWQCWREQSGERPELHYIALDKYPLQADDLARALAAWPALQPLSEQLLLQYPGLLPGEHRLLFEHGRVRLDLRWGDAQEVLADLAGAAPATVDAWYLDGFAPALNAAMWRDESLRAIAACSRPGATLATFTAAGQVRRGLAAAGFEMRKVAGFGRKREMLVGDLPQATPHTDSTRTPWDLPAPSSGPAAERPARVLVIGAGLAGCHIAASLARRDIDVTVLDQGEVAGAASGNVQGILYTRVSHQHSALVDFALQSFRFASALYRSMLDSGRLRTGVDGELCGAVQLAETSQVGRIASGLDGVGEFVRPVSATEAAALCGVPVEQAGYWFPGAGWIHPPALCRALLDHPRIELRHNSGTIAALRQDDSGAWHALIGEHSLAQAPCAVLATGVSSVDFEPCSWLPLGSVRGQTTLLDAAQLPGSPVTALCGEGYIAPGRNGVYCIGASFNLDSTSIEVCSDEHRENLESLAGAVPGWAEQLAGLDAGQLPGRVGFRCTSPDYLPVVGQVPEYGAFVEDFATLRANGKRRLAQHGRYHRGLYICTAHGSRGLTSTPLAAELLASAICGEPAPLSRELCRALSPARFIIRDLIRNRI